MILTRFVTFNMKSQRSCNISLDILWKQEDLCCPSCRIIVSICININLTFFSWWYNDDDVARCRLRRCARYLKEIGLLKRNFLFVNLLLMFSQVISAWRQEKIHSSDLTLWLVSRAKKSEAFSVESLKSSYLLINKSRALKRLHKVGAMWELIRY